MSLIQEALRRKQVERGDDPPTVEMFDPPPPRKPSAGWQKGLVLLLLLLLGALSGRLYLQLKKEKDLAQQPDAPPIAPRPGVLPAPVPKDPVPPAVLPPDTVVSTNTLPEPTGLTPPAPAGPALPEKLIGVLLGREGEGGSVILDTEIVELGESYHGVTVLRVEGRGASLLFNGSTQYVRVGKALLDHE